MKNFLCEKRIFLKLHKTSTKYAKFENTNLSEAKKKVKLSFGSDIFFFWSSSALPFCDRQFSSANENSFFSILVRITWKNRGRKRVSVLPERKDLDRKYYCDRSTTENVNITQYFVENLDVFIQVMILCERSEKCQQLLLKVYLDNSIPFLQ